MSLHSGTYIQDTVGHRQHKILQLRQDEVQVFNRMGVSDQRRISFPSRLADIRESAWLQGKDNCGGGDCNNNGWRRIEVYVDQSCKRERRVLPLVEEPLLFSYHNVQKKSSLVEDEEEEEERRDVPVRNIKEIQAEARRRFSVVDSCHQFPGHPYTPQPLYIEQRDTLNYILEEEGEDEDEQSITFSILDEEEDKLSYIAEEEEEYPYIVEEEEYPYIEEEEEYKVEEEYPVKEVEGERIIPIKVERKRRERKVNLSVERETSTIRELIKELSAELTQLKENRQLLEQLRHSAQTGDKFTTYSQLVENINHSSDSIVDIPVDAIQEEVEEDEEVKLEEEELLSVPTYCDELWLLPQKVLVIDVGLLQTELELGQDVLHFTRASSPQAVWMYRLPDTLTA